MKKGILTTTILTSLVIIIIVFLGAYLLIKDKTQTSKQTASEQTLSIPTPTPSPSPFLTYTLPKIQKKSVYTIFTVGDSMTHALGPHGGTFNQFINNLYKKDNISVLIDNYAKGSTNILQVNDQLTQKTIYWDSTFQPLLSRDFDLILVESFGYNPLSEFPLAQGLKKQTQALDETMKTLMTASPNSTIVFVATISPNRQNYAKKILPNLTAEERIKQVEERIAYIKNHIAYAKSHNIPIINIYDKSLNENGDGDLKYINPDDDIHPSFEGVDFIGHELANFIYIQQILPR